MGFTPQQARSGEPWGVEHKQQRYIIKVYDKGKEYAKARNLLRFEGKVIKMIHLAACGIVYLSDLLDREKLERLGLMLLRFYDDILLDDQGIDLTKFNQRDRELILKGRNPKYWKELTAINRTREKAKFIQLIQQHGTERYFETVRELIKSKWAALYKCNELTNPIKTVRNQLTISKGLKDNSEGKRYCQSCGREITGQKVNSKYCSEKLYGKEAKKCRNMSSNPRNNFKRQIAELSNKNCLFDFRPYLKLTEQQKEWLRHFGMQ